MVESKLGTFMNVFYLHIYPVGSLSFLTMSQIKDVFATFSNHLVRPSLNGNIVFCLTLALFPPRVFYFFSIRSFHKMRRQMIRGTRLVSLNKPNTEAVARKCSTKNSPKFRPKHLFDKVSGLFCEIFENNFLQNNCFCKHQLKFKLDLKPSRPVHFRKLY